MTSIYIVMRERVSPVVKFDATPVYVSFDKAEAKTVCSELNNKAKSNTYYIEKCNNYSKNLGTPSPAVLTDEQ